MDDPHDASLTTATMQSPQTLDPPVGFGPRLMAMSALRRVAWAAAVASTLWGAAFWAMSFEPAGAPAAERRP